MNKKEIESEGLSTEEIDGEKRGITWHLKKGEWVNVARNRYVLISVGYGVQSGSAKLRNNKKTVNVTKTNSYEYVTSKRDLITILNVVPGNGLIKVHTERS